VEHSFCRQSQGGQLTCWKTVLQHLFTLGIFVTIFFKRKRDGKKVIKKKHKLERNKKGVFLKNHFLN
jgi:hypothetical protein